MNPRVALLTLVPLLALQPSLSTMAAAHESFPDQQLLDQLREAQDYAMRAGQDLAQSLIILRQAIPRYGMPYVDQHGNIVIPRLPSPPTEGTAVPDPAPNGL